MANQTERPYDDLPAVPVGHQLAAAKVLAMVVLGLGSFLLGLAPLKMTQRWRQKSFSPSADAEHQRRQPRQHHQHHQHGQHQRHHQRHRQHSHPGDAASDSPTVSRLLCFGGGVLLSTTLLHLQPEVRAVVCRLQRAGLLPGTENLGDLLFCAGFFMVFFVDQLAHDALDRRSRRARGEDAPRRSMSLRRRRSRSPAADDAESERAGETRRRPPDDDRPSRGLFTVLALSFHEVFEGMAIGLEERVDHVWYLFLAVATHKLVIAFCVGLELAWSGTRRSVLVVSVAAFAAVTPVGIAGGMAIVRCGGAVDPADASPGPVAAVLQGLAAGTLLYVVFFEVLARHKRSDWSHLLAIAFGFGVLLALQMLTHHHHDHEHSHNHGDHGHGLIHGHAHDHEHGEDHNHERGH